MKVKGKPVPKIQRRAAGLQITAALEPRPNSGTNLASDIFRAVRENEEAEAQFVPKITQTSEQANVLRNNEINDKQQKNVAERKFPQPAEDQEPSHKSQLKEAEIVPVTALVSFGGGQMRVVSLQPPKIRKVNRQPKKMLRIVTGTDENQKIPTLFERTKAEELYDLLFQLTLGADEPCNSVRVRRSDLMASTNIKTRLTLDLNLKRLEENKLITVESRPGEQEGNIYTVFPLPNNQKG